MNHLAASTIAVSLFAATAQPPDWSARIAAGQMAFTADPAEVIGAGYFPVVGNGFIGIEAGPFVLPFSIKNQTDAGSLKQNGLYSGYNYSTPSHRVQVPRVSDAILVAEPGVTYEAIGVAVDWGLGVYYNRTVIVSGTDGRCDNTLIEQRLYAHRALRELLVLDIRASAADGSPAWSGCTLPVRWDIDISGLGDTALNQTLGAGGAPTTWAGTTTEPEEPGLPLHSLALAFDTWVAKGPTALHFTAAQPSVSLRAVLRSDLDVGTDATPVQVAQAAAATWAAYAATSPDALFASHSAAWADLWASGGIELTGNASFAATVNASLYDIISSLRADWNWSTSPGGIAVGGYSGHMFWDMETWMFPVLTVLYPDLARVAAQYRFDRLAASEANAAASGYDGAMWSWESASTGLWTSIDPIYDYHENHISADIPLAHRRFFLATGDHAFLQVSMGGREERSRFFLATGDRAFLQASWPSLNATCRFWECRFTRTDSTGPNGPPGYGPNCSAKDGSGNWTVHFVVPPDESAGLTNDSVYTNAAAAQTLGWCVEAAGILGIPPATLPPLWAEMSAAPYLPLNDTLYAGGPVHPEHTGYAGQRINQADVALLQYPLGLDFGGAQNQRDLDYYATVTDFAGMFTGDSSYACAYLALGNRSSADAQLALAFDHMTNDFRFFSERAAGKGVQHFVTGSGGYAQAFVFGYASLRVERLGVFSFASQAPVLPPYGVTAVKLRGVHLMGTPFDFSYSGSQVCAAATSPAASTAAVAAPLELRVPATGQVSPLLPGAPPVCVALQAVEVAATGFEP